MRGDILDIWWSPNGYELSGLERRVDLVEMSILIEENPIMQRDWSLYGGSLPLPRSEVKSQFRAPSVGWHNHLLQG